jgi:hypothetical protein
MGNEVCGLCRSKKVGSLLQKNREQILFNTMNILSKS